MMTNTKNPYLLTQGYQPNHDIPINGYGLTIDSIDYWLFEHKLNVEPQGLIKANPDEDADDLDFTAYENYLHQLTPANVLGYFSGANTDVQALLAYDMNPGVMRRTVLSGDELNAQLVNAIMHLWQVPDAYQVDLTKFVDQYADTILICDYC